MPLQSISGLVYELNNLELALVPFVHSFLEFLFLVSFQNLGISSLFLGFLVWSGRFLVCLKIDCLGLGVFGLIVAIFERHRGL